MGGSVPEVIKTSGLGNNTWQEIPQRLAMDQ
jgi:hypothetical protein